MHKTTNHRTHAAIVARLIVLVKPMLPIMAAAIVMAWRGTSALPSSPFSAALPS